MIFRFQINKFDLHYDTAYGCNNRSGWSFAWDGSFKKQLVSFWRLFL